MNDITDIDCRGEWQQNLVPDTFKTKITHIKELKSR